MGIAQEALRWVSCDTTGFLLGRTGDGPMLMRVRNGNDGEAVAL
jgi:hypothetical protein